MIPYWPAPSLQVGGLRFHAFGLMVGLALLTGAAVYLRRSRQQGLNEGFARLFILAVAAGGYLIAHFSHVLIFAPQFTLARALDFTSSIYSFGGIAGGLFLGFLLFSTFRTPWRERHMHLDNLAFAFVMAWIPARMGCSLAHDHIGAASNSFLAVRFPNGPHYDLGLLELLFTLLLAIVFLWMDRNPARRGYCMSLFLVTYGIFRLWRNTLEPAPRTWNGISLDTAVSLMCVAGGLGHAYVSAFPGFSRLRKARL